MSPRTNDLEADVVLIEKNGRFFFFQPDIGVIASDDKVEGAYGKFLEARRAFLTEVAHAGLALSGPTAVASASRGAPETVAVAALGGRGIAAELALFVAKLCIVFAVIGGIGAVLGSRAASGIASTLEQVKIPKQLSFEDVVRKAADIAKDMQSLTKEERETFVRSVGAISRELDPVVDAWRNPPPR
jgi:hypothetical protein